MTAYALQVFVVAGVDVFPDLSVVGDSGRMKTIAGALLMLVLIMAVLMLIVSAAVWALASSGGNVQAASRAQVGVWVSVVTAAVAGAAVAWLNFLIDLGRSI